jgi:multidrug resistance efflux pump
MTIRSLRPDYRPDNAKNQVRAGQSLARRIYLGALVAGIGWIGYHLVGPLLVIDADGLVMQDRDVVMPPYAAQVVSTAVRPGEAVAAGQKVATVVSTQMLDLIADLETRKEQADSRDRQAAARMAAISETLPTAERRRKAAEAAGALVDHAMAVGFTTAARSAETTRDRYDAAREVATLKAELASLESERSALKAAKGRAAEALAKALVTYRDGAVTSPVSGTVGAKVVSPGTVMSPGDVIADVNHGEKYVLAYLPTNRFYATKPGQAVVVTDGSNGQVGRIERIEAITDQLPKEFQSTTRGIDRQQVARVAISDAAMFPLQSKIKVTAPSAPSNLLMSASRVLANAAWQIAEVAGYSIAPAFAGHAIPPGPRPTPALAAIGEGTDGR